MARSCHNARRRAAAGAIADYNDTGTLGAHDASRWKNRAYGAQKKEQSQWPSCA
jgi:hypothetical protein